MDQNRQSCDKVIQQQQSRERPCFLGRKPVYQNTFSQTVTNTDSFVSGLMYISVNSWRRHQYLDLKESRKTQLWLTTWMKSGSSFFFFFSAFNQIGPTSLFKLAQWNLLTFKKLPCFSFEPEDLLLFSLIILPCHRTLKWMKNNPVANLSQYQSILFTTLLHSAESAYYTVVWMW